MQQTNFTMNSVYHPLSAHDADKPTRIRARNAPFKGALNGPSARSAYDPIFEAIPVADGITYAAGKVAGIEGVWCRPSSAREGVAILYLHGGGYVLGSAHAYRHFAGHFAARTQLTVFVAEYRLAPEHPFPAAIEDAQAAYRGLLDAGYKQIIVMGDSAGGGLSLALLSQLQAKASPDVVTPVAAVLVSPLTDLAMTGASMASKAEEDPMLTPDMIKRLAALYLGAAAPINPQASPLYAQLQGLPPLQIHVGTSEVLLDDSLRYAQRAQQAGVAASVHIWQDMPHVFPVSIGMLEAADESLNIIAAFIDDCLKTLVGV